MKTRSQTEWLERGLSLAKEVKSGIDYPRKRQDAVRALARGGFSFYYRDYPDATFVSCCDPKATRHGLDGFFASWRKPYFRLS